MWVGVPLLLQSSEWNKVKMNGARKDKYREGKVLSTLLHVPYIRKERQKRIVHHLPCICFGSTKYTIAIPAYENKQNHSHNPKKPPHKVQNLRFGKPSIGELSLSDKHKKLENISKHKRNTNSESLLLTCEKVEHIKKIQKRQYVEKPAHFSFSIPAFPAREEFVFRKRYRNQLPSKFPPRYLKKIGNGNTIGIQLKYVLDGEYVPVKEM